MVHSMITILSHHKTLMISTTSISRKTTKQSAYKLRRMFSTITLNAWSKKPTWSLLREKSSLSLRMQCSMTRTTIWRATCNQLNKLRNRSSPCIQSFYRKSNHLRPNLETKQTRTDSRSDTRIDSFKSDVADWIWQISWNCNEFACT